MRIRIRHKLTAIVALAVVPVVLYSLWDFASSLVTQRDRIMKQNIRLAMDVAENVDAQLEVSQQVLYPLSHHPAVETLDTKSCDSIFAELLPHFPNHLNILLVDMKGNNVGSGVNPAEAHRLNYLDMDWFVKGAAGKPVITDLQISKLLKAPAVMITQPIMGQDGSQIGVLGFSVNLTMLRKHLYLSGLPANSMVFLVDKKGNVLACSLHERMTGAPLKGLATLRTHFSQSEGMAADTAMDNVERLYSFVTMQRTGWKVLVGVPASEVRTIALHDAGKHLFLLLLVCLTGIPLAMMVAKKLSARIAQLETGLEEIERGNLDYRLPVEGGDELARVADAFNRMTSERLRAEREANQLRETLEKKVHGRTAELQTANEELESFCYSVSHDLRAPLRHINGFAHILLEDCSSHLDERVRHYLERITTSCLRMEHLIAELLSLSRFSRREMTREDLDLSRICRSVVQQLQSQEPERTVKTVIRDGIRVQGDPTLLTAVMENLLGNAWKYTARRENPCIEFGMEEADGMKRYFVRDNGAGFDMAHADKLFTPFHRLHNDREFEGTGVGLAIVRRIIRRHGGQIWAEAEPGKGATFRFTLPY